MSKIAPKLPIKEALTKKQKDLLLFMVSQGAEQLRSPALRAFGGVTAKDVAAMEKWAKKVIKNG